MTAIRVAEFDTWRPGYGLAEVRVLQAGTSVLADIFTDEALSDAADNPQTLVERVGSDGISYGRFSVPLYVGVPYELEINSVDRTGVIRPPLLTLSGEDASESVVTVDGGSEAITLEAHLARRIDIRDFGEFIAVGEAGASSATNNATLTAAMGVASAQSGGYVELPSGTYAVTSFTIPQGVVVRGQGRNATILQSTYAGAVATIGGLRCGLSRITLDGSTLVASSIGVLAVNKQQIVLDDCEVKRFETGVKRQGGGACNWQNLYISNCTNGALLYGDSASGSGGALSASTWRGGLVELCTTAGIEIKYVDAACQHQSIRDVTFDSNTGTAVIVTGARSTFLVDCTWSGNTANLTIEDASPATTSNTVIGLEVMGGSITSGTMSISGRAELINFRRMRLTSVTITLTTPTFNVVAQDCTETSVSFSGTSTSWTRFKTNDKGLSTGVTTGNSATKAWAITLASGQVAMLEAKVTARGRNVVDTGFFHFQAAGKRPGAQLSYDTQTGNFTAGNTITGATSGATARITADADSGTFGVLTVQDVVGTFVDDEIITDGATGSATVDGAIVTPAAGIPFTVTIASPGVFTTPTAHGMVAGTQVVFNTTGALPTGLTVGTQYFIISAGLTATTFQVSATSGGSAINTSGSQSGSHTAIGFLLIRTPHRTDSSFDAYFIPNGTQVELRVLGASSKTVEWTADVSVT